ncbi:hypothetical protein [Sporomusa sp.]|uniref:hypothetical protein n=1 Tax=Sporomusa sp. TaxID=2078658 RepID=UPI002CF7DAE0|nr:hypothetical protein [Sporomusa sp.]HWR06011.1 hypothetical protein [Sporomusa sp.]
MKSTSSKKIVSGIITSCLLLSLGTAALAHKAPEDQPPQPPCLTAEHRMPPNPADMERHISNRLDKLVKEETISQEQADKIMGFFLQKHAPDLIEELKSTANLSEEQAKAVADALRPPHRPAPCEGAPPQEKHPL